MAPCRARSGVPIQPRSGCSEALTAAPAVTSTMPGTVRSMAAPTGARCWATRSTRPHPGGSVPRQTSRVHSRPPTVSMRSSSGSARPRTSTR
jgi:hypothetical protein